LKYIFVHLEKFKLKFIIKNNGFLKKRMFYFTNSLVFVGDSIHNEQTFPNLF